MLEPTITKKEVQILKKMTLRQMVYYNTKVRQEESANKIRDDLIIDTVNNNQHFLTDAKQKALALKSKFTNEIQRRKDQKKSEKEMTDR